MKSLSNFSELVSVFESMAAKKSFVDHDNGTNGRVLEAYVYDTVVPFNKERFELQKQLFAMQLANKPASEMKVVMDKIHALPADIENMSVIMKLVKPITHVEGTKEFPHNGVIRKFSMKNVDTIYIKRKFIELGVIEFEETDQKAVNRQGEEVSVIKIKLSGCILETHKPIEVNGKVKEEAKVTIETLSLKTMQSLGRMAYYAKMNTDKLKGVWSDEELGLV